MLKRIITGGCFLLVAANVWAQTLFTYGNDSVSVAEFLAAYQKNNPGPKSPKALQEYLDLYIASRLKIKEAKARRYDTLPQILSEFNDLRAQITPAYLNDEESVNRLVNEAFARSQKDIRVAHIFISFLNEENVYDTVAARKKATEALAQLQKGSDFSAVAKQYSDDPSVQQNGGHIGYITVFSLPYELENIIYNTPSGKISPLHRSKTGYHIFKNLGERKAAGRIGAAQIVLAFPPDADAATKQQQKKRADSLYNRLLKGDDFGRLAAQFSNDVLSSQANGSLPEFGVGQYDPVFESVVFALPHEGAISKPFLTAQGYHIVKRISRTPVSNTLDDKTRQALRETVLQSDRMQAATNALAEKVLKKAGLQKAAFSEAELWAYTDSLLDYKPLATRTSLTKESLLFRLGNKNITVADWLNYAHTFRYKSDGSGFKPYTQVWDEFVHATATDYYKEHLEEHNEAFRRQLAEFKEGNLFFEIMQQEVWGPSQTDTAALQAYYEKHKEKYKWNKSADAVIFYAPDAATAKLFSAGLKKSPSSWRTLLANQGEKVTADSGRFELTQIPGAVSTPLQQGMITTPVINKDDNTASFAYIVKVYNSPAQRSFAEAKGQVINDYGTELERAWVAELKKKYPVVVNEKALASLLGK